MALKTGGASMHLLTTTRSVAVQSVCSRKHSTTTPACAVVAALLSSQTHLIAHTASHKRIKGPRTHVLRATASSSASGSSWKLGSLILYERKDGRTGLGLVQELEGKKNAFVVDGQSGRQVSIQPKQVISTFGGGPYIASDLDAFMAAANKAQEGSQSSLGEAWELAVADALASWSLGDLADLCLGDATPKNLFTMFSLLSVDKMYFKAGKKDASGDVSKFMYSPNSEEAVQQRKQQMEEQALMDAERARWTEAVKKVLAMTKRSQQPSRQEWLQGPYASRVQALEVTALTGDTQTVAPKELALAQESLSLAGINPPSANPQNSTGGNGSFLGSPLADKCGDLLADLRVLRAHEPLRVLRRNLSLEFPQKLQDAAQTMMDSQPEDACASLRLDLTHLRCYTIDDASTQEVDDGLSVTTLDGDQDLTQDGSSTHSVSGVRLWIHIADPTRWLAGAPGSSELMQEASERGRSMYFPWGSVPMFPESLSTGPFSLRDGEVCDALSVSVALDEDGSITDVQAHPTRVRITHKLTYDAADEIIAKATGSATESIQGEEGSSSEDSSDDRASSGDDASHSSEAIHSSSENRAMDSSSSSASSNSVASTSGAADAGVEMDMRVMSLALKARQAYRTAANCIEIPLPEANVTVPIEDMDMSTPDVQITRLSQWESVSRMMVAEMMILAGEGVGKLGVQADLPLPYRAQPQPELPSEAIQNSVPEGVCRGYLFRRCMTRSTVAPTPSRHSSLGLSAYVQVTSPIRRWMDIIAHFNLKAHLLGQPLPYSAADIERMAEFTDRQKAMGAAERAEESYWVAEYFRQRKAQGVTDEWPATVLGWQRQDLKLAAVLLDELGLEVVIKVNVDVSPGDYLMLGLLEARPLEGLLRFFVVEYNQLSGGAEAAVEGSEASAEDATPTEDELWPSAFDDADADEDQSDKPSSAEDSDAGSVPQSEVLLDQKDAESAVVLES